jgi:DNA-binding response OmpR family regulator
MVSRILLIDGHDSFVGGLQYALMRYGLSVCVAPTGRDGYAAARRSQPNAIVLDSHLPDLETLLVCRTLKSDSATTHIPIIVLVAPGSIEAVDRVIDAGATDYIPKDTFVIYNVVESLRQLALLS